MGKRNKGSRKQKKAHAKGLSLKHNTKLKDSSIFGVTVNKGKHSKGQRKSLENLHPDFNHAASSSKTSASNTNVNYSSERKANSNNLTKKNKMDTWHKPNDFINLRKDQETRDFARELASLNERKFQERSQKKSQNRSRRQHMITKSNLRMHKNSSITFTPATLQIRPKSIEDLVDDTAKRVAQNLGVHDGKDNQYPHSETHIQTNSNKSQILAAQKRNEWKSNFHKNGSKRKDNQMNINPFSLLNSDDEEDKKQIIEPPAIQFAPATFQFISSLDNKVNDWDDL